VIRSQQIALRWCPSSMPGRMACFDLADAGMVEQSRKFVGQDQGRRLFAGMSVCVGLFIIHGEFLRMMALLVRRTSGGRRRGSASASGSRATPAARAAAARVAGRTRRRACGRTSSAPTTPVRWGPQRCRPPQRLQHFVGCRKVFLPGGGMLFVNPCTWRLVPGQHTANARNVLSDCDCGRRGPPGPACARRTLYGIDTLVLHQHWRFGSILSEQASRCIISHKGVECWLVTSLRVAPDLEDELEEEDAAPPTASRRRGTDADAIGDFLEVCLAYLHQNDNIQTFSDERSVTSLLAALYLANLSLPCL